MIKGIGIDIVDHTRFDNVSDRPRFLRQLFTEKELHAAAAEQDTIHWAVCFAVKEAVMKAFRIGLHLGSHWHDIEVHRRGISASGVFIRHMKESTTLQTTQSSSKRHTLACVLAQE